MSCYSSLFCKRTHRHVGNPLSFQVSPRAKRDQTKSPARSANSPRKAISFQDAPEPEGRRRVTIGRHRRHLADAGHGHAVVDFSEDLIKYICRRHQRCLGSRDCGSRTLRVSPKHRTWSVPESPMIPPRQFRPSRAPSGSKSVKSKFLSRGT